jgi:hypothetical protein
MIPTMKRFPLLAVPVALCLALFGQTSAAAPPDSSQLDLSVSGGHVVVSRATPGKSVLIFSVGRRAMRFYAEIGKVVQVVPDSDGDGKVVLDVPTPMRSVWIAVDLQTAHYAVAAPDGGDVRVASLLSGFRASREGHYDELMTLGSTASILYVHPGGGAWELHAFDGSHHDRDGVTNGTIMASLLDGKDVIPVTGTERELVPGGLLFVIEPNTLDITVERLTADRLRGGRR